tara:strand:+ start:16556 stop:16915 length:360 start_codon:yes stop_codon:yes gene_type:complete
VNQRNTTISANNVLNDIIPKLNAVEKLVDGTLKEIVEASRLPAEIERYSKLQMEFQLELTMIRMNLEHLLKRYHKELEAVMNDPRQDLQLTLDQHESVAVESAKTLYQRVQELQTQGVS